MTQSFLGIPIEGNITGGRSPVPQRPVEDLIPLMQALLDDPTIKSFGWRQYTPYFNDGEPCEFTVHAALSVLLYDGDQSRRTELHDGTEQDEDDDDYYYDRYEGVEYSKHLGSRPTEYDDAARRYVKGPYEGPDEARFDRCLALEEALGSGAFDDALLGEFGDHAEITVTRHKVIIGTYEHD